MRIYNVGEPEQGKEEKNDLHMSLELGTMLQSGFTQVHGTQYQDDAHDR